VNGGGPWAGARAAEAGPGLERRRGIASSPGVVRGRIRRIVDPANAAIQPGEILVAERTDPGWVLLFPAAAGLLVEHGSLLSHSAIVARELRIPAIVSIDGLMAWLRDGDRVEFDGGTGWVERLEARGEASPVRRASAPIPGVPCPAGEPAAGAVSIA
jgi:pyruvate,water dikinase